MSREPPTRAEWELWRPTLIEWYKSRTADSIAAELKTKHGFNVTSKMLRDRFKMWNAEPKYHRQQPSDTKRSRRKPRAPIAHRAMEFMVTVNLQVQVQQELVPDLPLNAQVASQPLAAGYHDDMDSYIDDFDGVLIDTEGFDRLEGSSSASQKSDRDPVLLNGLRQLVSPEPSRTPHTPQEDCHLQRTLKEVAGYIDRIVEEGSWSFRYEEPAFELQKLAANAHMAISSQSYDCHLIWHELDQLYAPVCQVMPKFGQNNLLSMHPRALTVLLRVLVDSVSFGVWGSQTLNNVKFMFWIAASQTLQATHPLRLLCGIPKRRTKDLMFRLLELMDVRLYSRISSKQPDGPIFVAQEQTYAARVLASLGYPQWAEFKLQSVIDDLDTHMDSFTKADAYRTLGFMKEQACTSVVREQAIPILQASRIASASALNLFVEMGKGFSNEAMFTRISLAQASRQLGELIDAETYLIEAINVWQKTRTTADQGGSKLILDLHQVLCDQRKFVEARELRQQHQRYFEESRVYYEESGG